MNIIGVHKVHPRRKKAKFTAVDIADRREQESAALMRRAVNTVHRRLERARMRSMVIPTSTSVSHQLIASAVSNEVLSQDRVQAHIDGKKIYRGVHKWSPYERSLLRPPAPQSVEQPGAELDLLPPIEAARLKQQDATTCASEAARNDTPRAASTDDDGVEYRTGPMTCGCHFQLDTHSTL